MAEQATIDAVASQGGDKYKYGFITDIESEKAPKGLNAEIVRYISAKKNEPAWMLEWRLAAFDRWQTMSEPHWARLNYPAIDYQDAHYYSAPKSKPFLRRIADGSVQIVGAHRMDPVAKNGSVAGAAVPKLSERPADLPKE